MDLSQASINANQPEQTETIICMDLKYYNAAANGKIEVFKNITNHQYSLDLLLTPIKNTVLHIYITALNSKSTTTPNARSKPTTKFVKEIPKMCPSLLWKATAKDKTPSHIEARTLNVGSESTTNFVEEILKMCPSLLWKVNAKDETLLHIAARYGHDDIVKVLLKYCAQTLHQDLEDGIEPVKKMLRMTNKERDTALHEAVRYNHPKVVELLIIEDPKFSYSNNNAYETPLYIAAERGFKDVVFSILEICKSPIMHGGPLGRTALHAAVIRGDKYAGDKDSQLVRYAIEIIIKNPCLSNLLNEKNADGDTPLHFYSISLKSANNFVSHPRVDKMAYNKENFSAYDIASTKEKLPLEERREIMKAIDPETRRVITYEEEDKKNKDEEYKKKEDERSLSMLQKAAETHLVVAALITTVTFAACITMPGGFAGGGKDDSHQGSALLRRNGAFKAFVITDTISMVLSSSAVFIHLLLSFMMHNDDDEDRRYTLLRLAYLFILFAMLAMGLAFVMGTYAVLPSSWYLAFPNYIIGLTILIIPVTAFLKCFGPSFRWIYKLK